MVATADRAPPSPSRWAAAPEETVPSHPAAFVAGGYGGRPARRQPRRDVHRVDAAGAQRASGRGGELRRGQVRRRHGSGEHVRDHQVVAPFPHGLRHGAGVGGAHPDAVPGGQRQVPPDQAGERVVDLGDELPRPWPGVLEVARQRQRPAAEVQRAQRLTRRERQVGDMADPADVLELKVAGVSEVDPALRDAVDEQEPGIRPVEIRDELRGAEPHLLVDRDPRTARPRGPRGPPPP